VKVYYITAFKGSKPGEYMRTMHVYLQDCVPIDLTSRRVAVVICAGFFIALMDGKVGLKWLTNQI
jgi:hypothetical protein